MAVDYEKLWKEIDRLAKEEYLAPPAYARTIEELKEELGFRDRHEIRNFIERMIKEKKLKLWGKYKNKNYYVPFTSEKDAV